MGAANPISTLRSTHTLQQIYEEGPTLGQIQLHMPETAVMETRSPVSHQALKFLLYKLSNGNFFDMGRVEEEGLLDFLGLCIDQGTRFDLRQIIDSPGKCATSASILQRLLDLSVEYRRVAIVKICLQLGANPNILRSYGKPLPLGMWLRAIKTSDPDRTHVYSNCPCRGRDHCLCSQKIFNLFLEYHAAVTEVTIHICLIRGMDPSTECRFMVDYAIQQEWLVDIHSDCDYLRRGGPSDPEFLNLRRREGPESFILYEEIFTVVTPTPLTLALCSSYHQKNRLLERFLARNISLDLQLDAVITAAYYGDIEILRMLCSHGLPVDGLNKCNMSPLMAAASGQNPESIFRVCEFLLEEGAVPSVGPSHPLYGHIPSALHLHCTHRSPDKSVIDLLIGYRSDINHCASTKSWRGDRFCKARLWGSSVLMETPLEYAISHRNTQIANHLLSRGCKLSSRELLIAMSSEADRRVENDRQDELDLLQKLARDPFQLLARNNYGLTILQVAIRTGNAEDVDFLLSLEDFTPTRRLLALLRLQSKSLVGRVGRLEHLYVIN